VIRWRLSWSDDSFDSGNASALTVDDMSDQETGANEWRDLTRMAEEVFAWPGDPYSIGRMSFRQRPKSARGFRQ
jgi:hypothetical protein